MTYREMEIAIKKMMTHGEMAIAINNITKRLDAIEDRNRELLRENTNLENVNCELDEHMGDVLLENELLKAKNSELKAEKTPNDSCEGCRFVWKDADEYPCTNCKRNFADRFERG